MESLKAISVKVNQVLVSNGINSNTTGKKNVFGHMPDKTQGMLDGFILKPYMQTWESLLWTLAVSPESRQGTMNGQKAALTHGNNMNMAVTLRPHDGKHATNMVAHKLRSIAGEGPEKYQKQVLDHMFLTYGQAGKKACLEIREILRPCYQQWLDLEKGLTGNIKSRVHALELSEACLQAADLKAKVGKNQELNAAWEAVSAEVPTAEKVWETIEQAPISAAEIKNKNTLLRRK